MEGSGIPDGQATARLLPRAPRRAQAGHHEAPGIPHAHPAAAAAPPTRRERSCALAVERECAVIRSRPTVNGLPAGDRQGVPAERSLTVRLDGFAWEALEQESARLGVPVEELITFSVLYYLADIDSGRIARQISKSPYPDASR
jgi:hypothetical protein